MGKLFWIEASSYNGTKSRKGPFHSEEEVFENADKFDSTWKEVVVGAWNGSGIDAVSVRTDGVWSGRDKFEVEIDHEQLIKNAIEAGYEVNIGRNRTGFCFTLTNEIGQKARRSLEENPRHKHGRSRIYRQDLGDESMNEFIVYLIKRGFSITCTEDTHIYTITIYKRDLVDFVQTGTTFEEALNAAVDMLADRLAARSNALLLENEMMASVLSKYYLK
jgi:hypothetical protein